jgi:hypothetical protein
MNTGKIQERPEKATREGAGTAVITCETGSYRFRLLAIMVQGTAGALAQAWRSYLNVEEARRAARELIGDQRVSAVAIVEDRPPLRFVEWVER